MASDFMDIFNAFVAVLSSQIENTLIKLRTILITLLRMQNVISFGEQKNSLLVLED
jgi:hypothetical protein